jgi:hypothetical protein
MKWAASAGGGVGGSGTAGTVPVWSGAATLGDSPITVSGSDCTFGGKVLVLGASAGRIEIRDVSAAATSVFAFRESIVGTDSGLDIRYDCSANTLSILGVEAGADQVTAFRFYRSTGIVELSNNAMVKAVGVPGYFKITATDAFFQVDEGGDTGMQYGYLGGSNTGVIRGVVSGVAQTSALQFGRNTGYVGVCGVTPSYPLHVSGNAYVTGNLGVGATPDASYDLSVGAGGVTCAGVAYVKKDNAGSHAIYGVGAETQYGALTDGYLGAVLLFPTYDGLGQTITRHNYCTLQNPGGTATVTDACVFRFPAAAGTHKAVDSGSTKSTPGGVSAWMKVNVNGTIYFSPLYLSKTA